MIDRDDRIPRNRVIAQDLDKRLQDEYGKDAWREAMANAKRRWEEDGGKIEKIPTGIRPRRSSDDDLV